MRAYQLFLLFLWEHYAFAQQFEGIFVPVNYPGISQSCSEALNTTLPGCPWLLFSVSVDNPRLTPNELSQLCTSDCHASLKSARKIIAEGCNHDSDIIAYDETNWPATLIIDRFLYTYDLSCRKDPASGRFCDEVLLSWLSQKRLTPEQDCSDCILGAMQTQLNSPFGWTEESAEYFESQKANCSTTEYPVTSPASYAINASSTSTQSPISTPICADPYEVQPDDTCESISLAQNVSTFGLMQAGGLSPSCHNLQAVGSLCLPPPCTLYRVHIDDTCDSIVEAHPGMTGTNILAWNPSIHMRCGNIRLMADEYICVGPPGGSLGPVTASSSLAVSTKTTPAPRPTNAPGSSSSRCGKWYVIQEGDSCEKVSIYEQITLDDFLFLNPGINSTCGNLLLGIAYCVEAVGAISTYSGYPTTSQIYTLPSMTYTTTTSTLPSATPPRRTSWTPLPTAPGTVENCEDYIEYFPVPDLVDSANARHVSVVEPSINSCDYAMTAYEVPTEAFLDWNPSLASIEPCMLQPGYRYCVTNGTKWEQDPEWSYCFDPEEKEIPPGTAPECSCFTVVKGYDKEYYPCETMARDFDLSVERLTELNSWLGSDCDTSLYANLTESDSRYVCIRSKSTAPASSTTSGIPPSSTATSTDANTASTTSASQTTPTAPTQTGIAADCTRYYTVEEGDSCARLESEFSITFDQLHEWNPSIGSNCEYLQTDFAYCVAAPSSPTSISASGTIAPPAPTRSGTPSTCAKYYVVQKGDSCWDIAKKFDIDTNTLYKWNPSVGADCEALWPDYSLCVADGS